MEYDIVLRLPEGDQCDLEYEFANFMVDQVQEGKMIITKDNYWGESYVLQGSILHGIQWKFIVKKEYNEEDEVVAVYFEDDIIDFEVDCSWHENENYKE